ncbi:MFS transporter [Rathayibacter sp. VKM Ac-2804]|uniref:MFS transporter n=1 Tax=unclassified Rathayibacter TaxID=2609250 RepID=UPI00132EC844|nr:MULTISPECIES: MFS transporter [unclassified Rathayibacter]NRG39916.1 MFS transporter [Rathayibacter sp. VKM Ac-2835]QHF25989.1 MFS transporter [Rathayibacter sp. VKM Ac-2804]
MGGFGIGSTEFVAMGLLPQLAADLLPDVYAVSSEQANSQAGLLISAYALGVVVGAPTIAAAAARWPRKRLLLILLAAFTIGTVASALLPTFPLVLAARFVAALPHGAYFGIASLVAADLMGPGKRGKGVAFVLSGLTIANVVGVPAITWVGQNAGWRSAYLVVAAIFAATVVAVWLLVPLQQGNPAATMRNELKAFGRLQVWMTLAIGAIGFGGLFAMYSYITPLSTEVTGVPLGAVPWILVVVGLGMTVGNLVGGWAADKNVRLALIVLFCGVLVSLTGLALTATSIVGLLVFAFLAAGCSAGASPAIQTRLMDVARDSQTIAAALNHSALNIGNSVGAALGGVTIAAGLGYVSPIWVGVVLTVAGILLAFASLAIDRARGTVDPLRDPSRPATGGVPVNAL